MIMFFDRLFKFFFSHQIRPVLANIHTQKCASKTAGVIVIGDEILKGDVLDSNSNYMLKCLHQHGINVKKVSVLPDVVDDICEETKLFSNNYDYVLTTGGIGPTHDDVTFEAVAKAFDEKLVPHPKLVDICCKFYNTDDLNAPGMKLAFVPESAKLIYSDGGKYPVITVRNVHLFPGVPHLMKVNLDALGSKLYQSEQRFYCRTIYFNVKEQNIVEALNQLVKEYPQVMFGSYPEMFNREYQVRITIESTDEKLTTAATEKLLQLVPKQFVVK